MDWLVELWRPGGAHAGAAHALLVLALVAAAGLALGSVRVRGVGLGVAGVLFSGLLFGHLGVTLPPEVLELVRELGLVLFVYTIGLQVGPGFVASLRRNGLVLNGLAAAVVVLGVAVTYGVHRWGGVSAPVAVGLYAGAVTNTPSLAAAQQALRDQTAQEALRVLPGLGYAVAYPFGIVGILLTLGVLRRAFRVDVAREAREVLDPAAGSHPPLASLHIEVRSAALEGRAVRALPWPEGGGVVLSRVRHGGRVSVPTADTRLHLGDVVLAVGPPERLQALCEALGVPSDADLTRAAGALTARRLVVTRRAASGRRVTDLDLLRECGVVVTRVVRAGVELPVSPAVRLQYGDAVLAVGEPEALARAASILGDAPRVLDHPLLVPVFVGVALGVLLGSVPFQLPGLPAPVRLGLAGGPLLVALVVSRLGRVGPLVWYMPTSANLMLRELGIALFLACVGLKGGGHFVQTLLSGDGLRWAALAAAITLVPLLVVGALARALLGTNYLTLCGLLAGSMTDPPALAFATSTTGSEGPSIAYATVYPLTMLLRVLSAQVLVLTLG